MCGIDEVQVERERAELLRRSDVLLEVPAREIASVAADADAAAVDTPSFLLLLMSGR